MGDVPVGIEALAVRCSQFGPQVSPAAIRSNFGTGRGCLATILSVGMTDDPRHPERSQVPRSGQAADVSQRDGPYPLGEFWYTIFWWT